MLLLPKTQRKTMASIEPIKHLRCLDALSDVHATLVDSSKDVVDRVNRSWSHLQHLSLQELPPVLRPEWVALAKRARRLAAGSLMEQRPADINEAGDVGSILLCIERLLQSNLTDGLEQVSALQMPATSHELSVSSECAISVLGSFGCSVAGEPRSGMAHGSQRLLAFLALRDHAITRTALAKTLWPEVSTEDAHSSLRSALSRLNGIRRTVVRVTSQELCLVEGVSVDIREARLLAHRILNPGAGRVSDMADQAITTLSVDLLPDWYDDWAVVEAEEWRQLRLLALDTLAERLTASGRYGDATSAALAAVRAEPLREKAHATLIRTYLAEGNRAEAISAYEHYRALLQTELGLEPTPQIQALVTARQ
jgi:DNA-binding SARP family transcriptional activator